MTEHLALSVGIGLAVSLVFSELFGLAAGGMIVPGYVALSVTRPLDVLMTVVAGLATYLVVTLVSSFLVVYGRRRTVLMILVGYLIGMLARFVTGAFAQSSLEFQVIGFIIPGLIGLWLDRQGIIETLALLVTASVVVRLILVLVVGAELRG